MRNKLATIALAGTLSLYGCRDSGINPETNLPNYFASVPFGGSIMEAVAITNGDFDGDGDLDLVVVSTARNEGRLYHFKNDGQGNFSLYSSAESP